MGRNTTRNGIAAITALLTLAATGCQLPTGLATNTATTAPAALADLTIAPEDTGAHYDRDNWAHWSSQDGCDTRDQVLTREALAYRKGEPITYGECEPVGNAYWVSVYDNETVTDPGDLDIDHIVPLAEAARSGSRAWTDTEREAYANDLSGLIAVTVTSNRQKGDQDPASWLPGRDRCGYVTRWIEVKREYGLTADRDEADAIASVLARC
jgi:hypothetical protein